MSSRLAGHQLHIVDHQHRRLIDIAAKPRDLIRIDRTSIIPSEIDARHEQRDHRLGRRRIDRLLGDHLLEHPRRQMRRQRGFATTARSNQQQRPDSHQPQLAVPGHLAPRRKPQRRGGDKADKTILLPSDERGQQRCRWSGGASGMAANRVRRPQCNRHSRLSISHGGQV